MFHEKLRAAPDGTAAECAISRVLPDTDWIGLKRGPAVSAARPATARPIARIAILVIRANDFAPSPLDMLVGPIKRGFQALGLFLTRLAGPYAEITQTRRNPFFGLKNRNAGKLAIRMPSQWAQMGFFSRSTPPKEG